MADRVGVSPATVQRIWDARGVKPHRVETFKLCIDTQFEDKLIDVVGLYLNPPKKAVVLCMDEKAASSARGRGQHGGGAARSAGGPRALRGERARSSLLVGVTGPTGPERTRLRDAV
jgi:hypothetical protein